MQAERVMEQIIGAWAFCPESPGASEPHLGCIGQRRGALESVKSELSRILLKAGIFFVKLQEL
ncbi:MAG TPA: hypothetical protein VFW23_15895 [Tepidisphaeraceae bacterium]|nr:hypothetical protein [Tepidisphaeraceae bacterium]